MTEVPPMMNDSPRSGDPMEGTPAEPDPDVSVIVAVYNRSSQLRNLLAALAQQTLPRERFEVLICDDGSTEDLGHVVADASGHGLRVFQLRQVNRGPGCARNLGLARARGEIVAFTDSDCVPDSGWLASLVRAFDDPSVGLVGGVTGYRGSERLSGRCTNFLMSCSLGAAGARDPRSLVHMRFYPRTCNLAARRELALAVDGFPPFRHGEDLEFSHRIRERQRTAVRFVPEAIVIHDEVRTLGDCFREAFFKGAARVRLWRDCGLHQSIHALPAILCLYLLLTAVAALLVPAAAAVIAAPGLAYLLLLGIVGVQGAIVIGAFRAVGVIPIYALVMHLGYGLGYLAALLRLAHLRIVGRAGPPLAGPATARGHPTGALARPGTTP